MTKIYLAGPMESAGGNLNFPLFKQVTSKLRAAGAEVFSPAEHAESILGSFDEIKKLSKTELKTARRMLLADELQWLCKEAEIVFLLPGWERSPGATAERAVALALGLDVRETPEVLIPADWEPELDIPAEP